MLQRLFVQNVLFIDQIDVDFVQGFSVITGETGSGKSILLECIRFCLGDKFPANFSSKENLNATIFLEFDISNNEFIKNILQQHMIEAENNLLCVRRIYTFDKKSKIFINDVPVNLSLLKELSPSLIEYQGQHSQTILLDVKQQQYILDQYGELAQERAEVSDIYKAYNSENIELKQLEEEIKLQDVDREYYKFVLKELENLAPVENEVEVLADKRKSLLDRNKITDSIKEVIAIIEQNRIETCLNNAYKILLKISEEGRLENELQILDKTSIDINEIINSLNDKLTNLREEEDLKTIEDRFFLIKELARKYRCAPNELGKYLGEVRAKLTRIDGLEKIIADKIVNVEKIRKQYFGEAEKLSAKRKLIATKLEKNLEKELVSLKMDKTIFKVSITSSEEFMSQSGIDKIEFLVTTNPDMPLGPLKEVSSGGELSRFMLAIRVVLLQLKSPPTIIFDEIDTGIGGAVADAVGEKLALLSKNYQLLVITHHPQVAVKASSHYLIEKKYEANETKMNINHLDQTGKREELARMLSGKSVTSEARVAASQLLSESHN